ncbi:putative transmembrane protein [Encephalitozoon intestinalis ATCC 50506]|uniref:Protein YOP1 n=1 Tax=Encephalitozoon intestinalis (strain ATCC 50506) TaxID=876142 RepID=E0S6Y4_ENCIT|nr:putative transmembrane protein [Encephalitozoon intestinalis ATCC 50506]ADM11570.1 putative transmembrane protein [Encephalitozoon intestinalis ATCC 50506]UTX45286.1 TB2/DP1-like protein [Encephalitozoon intestinalis]
MISFLVNAFVAMLVLYNVLQSFRACREDKRVYKRYNKYFMVIAVFLVLDNLFSFVLDFIPFYQLFKLIVVAWISIPACTGAVFVYKFYIRGFMEKYQGDLEEIVERTRSAIFRYFNEYYEKAQKNYRGRGTEEMEEEILGIKNEEGISKMSPNNSHMEDVSDSGFSTIDSTVVNGEKNESSLSSKMPTKPVDHGQE